jgi:putative flippase GtrA
VTFARTLYERFRQLIHEFAKFGVIGVIGLVITNVVYDLLYNHLGFGPVKATTIATVVAAMVTYLGNRYWSFKHRERTSVWREGIIFCLLNGIGLLIQDAAVAFNYYTLGLGNNKVAGFIALNFGIGIATLFRFWSYRRFVWLSPGEAQDTGGPAEPQAQMPQVPRPVDGYPTPGLSSPVARANGRGLHRANGHAARDGVREARTPYQG